MTKRFLALAKEAELFLRTLALDHPHMAELAEKLREEIQAEERMAKFYAGLRE